MRILQDLRARRGITIVLITHEPDIAAYASRIITVRDGRILSDTPNTPRDTLTAELAPAAAGA